jgi:hypothetical protein
MHGQQTGAVTSSLFSPDPPLLDKLITTWMTMLFTYMPWRLVSLMHADMQGYVAIL